MNNNFEIRRPSPTHGVQAGSRRPFTPRVTPIAEQVDTSNAALEFPAESEPEDFFPERPAPLVRVVQATLASPPRGAVPRTALPVPHSARRLLWLTLAITGCAPMVWLALRDSDRTGPPQTAAVQTSTVQTSTLQTSTVQTSTVPSPSAQAPKNQIVLAAPTSQRDPVERVVVPLRAPKPAEPPRTIERRRARLRDSSPALVPRATTGARVPGPSAPAAASTVFHGALLVVSEPSGARVFVNGRFVGSTPIQLEDVPTGSRVIRVEADGYESWASAIRVVANQQTRVSAALRR